MKKNIVIYYSNKGSNQFLAHKIANTLACDIEAIRPRLNLQLPLMMGLSFGNHKIKADISNYDTVILCGPIWMGKLIDPLKKFITKYLANINKLIFVSCCGSSFDVAEEKYGHELVFKDTRAILNEKCIYCKAFPINLVLPDEQKNDSNLIMKTRLSMSNFKGEILSQFNTFIQKVSSGEF